jgi:hypothetical protein
VFEDASNFKNVVAKKFRPKHKTLKGSSALVAESLLVTIFTKAFLPLVRSHFGSLPFLSTRHELAFSCLDYYKVGKI